MSPSSNWLALKKNMTTGSSRPTKRRKVEPLPEAMSETSSLVVNPELESSNVKTYTGGNRDTPGSLRQMVYGQEYYPPARLLPGKYVAIDCEMVGIAGDSSKKSLAARDKGDESSLARVSVVNYHGAVQLDVFVKQRERVTDWRTAVSGVRESDMLSAKSFSEVQKLVAELLKDRILVGHAVHNDMKALLLSHPHNMTRDTQVLAGRHGTMSTSKPLPAASDAGAATVKVSINRKPALRKLVIQELGIDMQVGEHSSVTDARATMAIYRLHRRTWDKGFIGLSRMIDSKQSKAQLDRANPQKTSRFHSQGHKRSREDQLSTSDDDAQGNIPNEPRTPQSSKTKYVKRKGISSGLSVVVKRGRGGAEVKQAVSGTRSDRRSTDSKDRWWGTLGT
ncbi:ribonuclease H-like domain-containing protein [Gautieria morchelliformis]|nr:ribonuclease H-like domain-containing protein [Gautieria morchelliformis]